MAGGLRLPLAAGLSLPTSCSHPVNHNSTRIAAALYPQPLLDLLVFPGFQLPHPQDSFLGPGEQTGFHLAEPLGPGALQFGFCRRGHVAQRQVPSLASCLLPLTQSQGYLGGTPRSLIYTLHRRDPGKGHTSWVSQGEARWPRW